MDANNLVGDKLDQTCPTWGYSTLVVHDEGGHIVGYGKLIRNALEPILIDAAPDGVALLSSILTGAGG